MRLTPVLPENGELTVRDEDSRECHQDCDDHRDQEGGKWCIWRVGSDELGCSVSPSLTETLTDSSIEHLVEEHGQEDGSRSSRR